MGGGTSKPSQNPNFDGNEDDYDDEEGQQTQQNKPVSSYRQNQSQNYARPSQNYGSTRTQGKPVNRPPPQEEEYDDQDQGEEQDQDEEEEEVEEEMQQTPINRKPAPRQNAGISNSQRQGMNYNSPKSKPAYQSPMNGGYRQTKNNVVSGKEQFNEMEEDLPKFSQFVKVIKSPIPYPMDQEALLTAPLAKGFEFTNNTNVFNVFEEERLALVPRSEMLKPFMVLKEVLNNEWDDEDFPSEPESLSKEPKHDMILKKIMWKKISEIAPAQGFAIIYDTNRPDCIIPGKLNNRAFQSALSILAETEHYLPSVFPEFNETSNSVLSLWLNHTGEWKVYTVDEKFPYDKETMNWAFTHSKNETWVLILEKAFAKMYGTYFALELGHTAHFIHDITGAPYRYFYFDDPEECWKFLNSFDLAVTTVVAMNKAQKYKVHDEDDLSKAPSYAYTVLDLREVRTSKGLEKIVKLRDPWPQKTWGGDWSNQSKKWTKPIMDLLCPDGLFDDEFWIGIPDFVKYYGMGFSFKLFTSYQHSSIRLKHSYERNHSLILMNIQNECNMFLQVNQPDHRHFLSFDEPYSYSLVKMMVVEVDAWLKPRRFITGLYNKGRDCEVECRLMPGDYLVFIEVDWEQNLNREIVFSTYGEINAVLYEINCLEEKLTLVRRFLHQYFKSSAEYEEVMDYGNFGDKRVKRYIDYVYGYLCFYYQNKSEMYGLTEKVKMESIFGLQITQPFTDDFEFDVNLRANSDFLVVYETTPDGQMAYHYKHRSWSYLYPDGPEDIVKKLVMTKAKKILKRKMDGKDIDVFVHIYAFNGGYCFYYNNKTKYIYRERLGLDLFNLVGFDNSEQTYFEIKLEPKEDFVLKFKVKDPLQPFSYASRVSYKINQTREQEENDDVEEEEIPQNQPNQSPPKGAPMMFPKPVRDMLMKHVKNYDDSQKIVRPLKYQQQNQSIRQQEPNIADRR